MKTFRLFLVFVLFSVFASVNCYSQVGTASKEVGKKIGHSISKKAAKKTAEKFSKEAAEKTAKESAKRAAKETSKKAAAKTSKEAAEKSSKEAVQSMTKKGVEKAAKETAESVGGKAAKNTVKQTAKESTSEMAKKEAKEVSEKTVKNNLKKQAAEEGIELGSKKVGKEAMKELDDMPALKATIEKLQKKSPEYYKTEDLIVTKKKGKTTIEFKGKPDKIEVQGNVIKAKGGSTAENGGLNQFLNDPMPNQNYKVDNHITYKTNSAGKPTEIECHSSELSKKVTRTGRDSGTQKEILETANVNSSTHQSGHLVQNSVGGPNEKINQLPMPKEMNNGGLWKQLESDELEAIKKGKDVWTKMKINYKSDGSYDIVKTLIIDGIPRTETFHVVL